MQLFLSRCVAENMMHTGPATCCLPSRPCSGGLRPGCTGRPEGASGKGQVARFRQRRPGGLSAGPAYPAGRGGGVRCTALEAGEGVGPRRDGDKMNRFPGGRLGRRRVYYGGMVSCLLARGQGIREDPYRRCAGNVQGPAQGRGRRKEPSWRKVRVREGSIRCVSS